MDKSASTTPYTAVVSFRSGAWRQVYFWFLFIGVSAMLAGTGSALYSVYKMSGGIDSFEFLMAIVPLIIGVVTLGLLPLIAMDTTSSWKLLFAAIDPYKQQ